MSMYVSVEESRTPRELVPWVSQGALWISVLSHPSFDVSLLVSARTFLLYHYLWVLRKKLRGRATL